MDSLQNLVEVSLVQDESSHWYCIPLDLRQQFYHLSELSGGNEEKNYKAQNDFDDLFNRYRVGGSLSLLDGKLKMIQEDLDNI